MQLLIPSLLFLSFYAHFSAAKACSNKTRHFDQTVLDNTDWFSNHSPNPNSLPGGLSKRYAPVVSNGFYPNHCAEAQRVADAFSEVLVLVQTALTYPAQDPSKSSFTRYFQLSDYPPVFNVFAAFFRRPGDPLSDPINTDDTSGFFIASYKFTQLAITYGLQPGLSDPVTDCVPSTGEWGQTYNGVFPLRPSAAMIVLCPEAFADYGDLPISGGAPCHVLQPYATYDMLTLSGAILHEMLHFDYLTQQANNGEEIEDWNADDDPTAIPINGYGPYHSWQINQLSAQPGLTTPRPAPTRNADNFVWFALEAYWSTLCGVEFVDPMANSQTLPLQRRMG